MDFLSDQLYNKNFIRNQPGRDSMKRWQADGAIVGAGALWGLSYIFTRWGLEHSPPAMFLLGRFSLALVVTLVLFGSRLKSASRRTIRRGLILGGLMGGGALLQAYSVNFTDVSRAAFITALTLPATPLASFLLFREKVSRYSLAGVVLSLLGLYLLLDPRFTGLNVGDMLAALSVPLWALFMIYMNIFISSPKARPPRTSPFSSSFSSSWGSCLWPS
jgi:drug/metabolite transporter (DMT)-like permease